MNKKVAIHHNILSDKDVDSIQHGSKVNECNKEYTLVKENEVSSVKSSGEKARRKKLYGIEDKDFSQLNCPEKAIRKKQRTIKTVGKETLDDIPMDIVELLAKNQQERNLMDTYFTDESKHEVLMTQGEMRHVNDSYASGHHGEKVSKAKYKSNGVPNDAGYHIPTASCDNQNPYCGASKSVECQKQILIDLNEKAAEFLTSPHWNGQRPWTSDLPVDSVKIYSNQNSSWDGMKLLDKYQGFSAQSTSRSTHHFLSLPLLGEKYGVTSCNYRKMIPCNLVVDRTQKVYQETEFLQTRNLITSSCFACDEGTYEKSINGIFQQKMESTTSMIFCVEIN